MSLITTAVKFTVLPADGVPIAGLRVRADLTRPDVDGGVLVPQPRARGDTDANGQCTIHLWPNSRGVNASQYRVKVYQGAELIHSFLITVPESGGIVLAESIINQAPYPAIDAAQAAITAGQAAVVEAQGAAADASASAAAAHASEVAAAASASTSGTQAGIATAKAALTAADATATAADRTQTVLDRTAAAGSASSASTSAGTATTQASTATTQAGIATAQAALTAADRVQTGLDRTAALNLANSAAGSASTATTQAGIATAQAALTAADRVQTGLDRTAASNSASSASGSASTATTQAGIATTKAVEAAASAATAAAIAGGDISAAANKATPVDADKFAMVDSAASWVLKTVTWANIKAVLSTYFKGLFAVNAGVSGGQTLIGGSGVTDALVLQGTSGNGTSTSPAVQIKVGNAGATTAATVLNNGKVGIGVVPTSLLHVGGSMRLETMFGGSLGGGIYLTTGVSGSHAGKIEWGDGSGWILRFGGPSTIAMDLTDTGAVSFSNPSFNGMNISSSSPFRYFNYSADDWDLQFRSNSVAVLTLDRNRRVGVGTASPSEKFHVVGNIKCASGVIMLASFTVATLPSAATSGAGAMAYATDANATTYRSTVASGGANKVQVTSDGSNWLITG